VNKSASLPVGASTDGVECLADLGLVLGMAGYGAKFNFPVGELTFHAVSTSACLLEGSARLSLVEILRRRIIFAGGIRIAEG